MIAGFIFLAQNRDMMICPVHGRAHQVGGAGVDSDIVFISLFFMQDFGDQMPVGTQHETAAFSINGDISQAVRHQDLIIGSMDAFSDNGNVIGLLIGTIGDADASGQVDE